ncbi:MAG: DUF3343 domain-containing protein [Atopobiaceae bacterium]|nr:DUF3343 domain-containing protein [Atopobiaceae bacterium]
MGAVGKSLVVTFASTHDAMAAESALMAQGVPGRIIPTPTVVTAECGLAWKSPLSARDALSAALEALAHEEILELEV